MSRNGRVARTPLSAQNLPPALGAPAALNPEPPILDRTNSSAEELVRLSETLLQNPTAPQIKRQREAVENILSWLGSFPGQDWQDRWILSGSDASGATWGPAGLSAAHRLPLTTGLGALLALRAVRPSYSWLFSSRLLGVYDAYRRNNQAELFKKMDLHLIERGGSTEHSANALNVLTRLAIVTGKDLLDLDTTDIDDYGEALTASGRQHGALPLAYQALHAYGAMPGCPPTLVQFHHIGQRTPAELVDRFPIVNRPFRDMLVHYLTERCAMLDYASLVNQSQMLVDLFWADLERHHPGICSLNLDGPVAAAWKQRLRTLPNGKPRLNYHSILLAVRAFYLDLHQWSLEDPARWAPWAAPCPIREVDTFTYRKETRLRRARMQQRTRTLAPVLSQLVAATEEQLRLATLVLQESRNTAPGDQFTVEGVRYRRTGRAGLRQGPAAIFLTIVDGNGLRFNAERDEDNAFWLWAAVEVLRRTGVRIEELLELTHLSLRHYQAPTGEMIPLIQISPSKTDRERVIPATPELVAVLARILRRLKEGEAGQVPLVVRYDLHERIFGPPLPHLFQTVFQHRRLAIAPAHIRKLLGKLAAETNMVDVDGSPLRFTPHDFRRIFATETVNGGLPIHIAAKLLGHLDLNTTQGYVAVYPQDVIHHYRNYVDQRRKMRPSEEYREPTDAEWNDFRDHFSLRKVALGTCERPYGTPCEHEHACVRCPMLRMDPQQLPRLLQIQSNTEVRLKEAHKMQWLGEVSALQEGLRHIAEKTRQAERLQQLANQPRGNDDFA